MEASHHLRHLSTGRRFTNHAQDSRFSFAQASSD